MAGIPHWNPLPLSGEANYLHWPDYLLLNNERIPLRARPEAFTDSLPLNPGRLLIIAVAGALATSAMVACAPTSLGSSADAAEQLVGLRLSEAAPTIGDDSLLLVQDASPRLQLEASFSTDDLASSRWLVVAACSDATTLKESSVVELAVVPASGVADLESVDWDRFADAVLCDF